MKINSVLIAGAGAIGLSTAESIYKTDPACVTILANGERLERYKKNGLKVNGEKLDFAFSGDSVNGNAQPGLILIACKFHHLDEVINDIRPYVGKDTIILSLLNGITSEEIIEGKLKCEKLPLAMVLGTDAFHEKEGTSFTKKGVVHFGDRDGMNGEREDCVADFFSNTGVPFALEQNMKRKLWFKYMMNVGVNQVSAVLRIPYGAIQSKTGSENIPEAHILVQKTMREVIAVANAEGIDLGDDDIANCFAVTDKLSPTGYTSMCQDIMAGRKTEVEMFSLTLMDLAKKHGIPVPVNEMLYLEIRAEERKSKVVY